MLITIVTLALSSGSAMMPLQGDPCLNDDGFVVPCKNEELDDVEMQFADGTLPTRVGVPADIYLSGGDTLVGSTNYAIRANKQVVCNTDQYEVTPIRHCTATINTPGTYTFDAVQVGAGGNGLNPYPVTRTVSP